MSLGIMILKRYNTNGFNWIPPNFTRYWLTFYGKIISVQMLVSNVLPFSGPIISVVFKRCCCCCKRKNYKLKKYLNPEYPLERRYGNKLATTFTAFTYGFAIPSIFVVAAVVFGFVYIVDKLLITFYFKERVIHNNLLDRFSLRMIKYVIVVFFYFAGNSMY